LLRKIKKHIKNKISFIYENRIGNFYFKHSGECPCCNEKVDFIARNSWLRDNFKCSNCGTIPRERALMLTIKEQYPNWKDLKMHESSPGNRGHSLVLKKFVKDYQASQYYGNENLGSIIRGFRNEDLENQTFEDEQFDIVVTSDVMEHIYNPEKAFKEIHRTLKKGGAHIFSVPLINKHKKTEVWATKGENGEPVFLKEEEWHGNPIDSKGSPVTMHWGFDIIDFIEEHTDSSCEIIYLNNIDFGIRAEYIEIIVAKKNAC